MILIQYFPLCFAATTPFLMVLGIPAAHDPFTPAPQYMNEFNNEKAPRTPGEWRSNIINDFVRALQMSQIILSIAYNYVDEPGHEKHWIVQIEPRQFDATAEEEIDRQNNMQCNLQPSTV